MGAVEGFLAGAFVATLLGKSWQERSAALIGTVTAFYAIAFFIWWARDGFQAAELFGKGAALLAVMCACTGAAAWRHRQPLPAP